MAPAMGRWMPLLLCGAFGACAGTDRVTFVTATRIAIDADATTQSLAIGYGRDEGYLGPAYETGAVPPVVAKIDSNLSPFRPQVKQFYATGRAAVLATCKGGDAAESDDLPECPELLEPPKLTGGRRIMFFGTSAVLGFKASWAGNAPEAVTLGYKRKEFSWLPIGRTDTTSGRAGASPRPAPSPTQEDAYGSVLASLNLDTQTLSLPEAALALDQFFATGLAAENLANTRQIKAKVGNAAEESARRSLTSISVQTTPTGELVHPAAEKLRQELVANPASADRLRACWTQLGVPADTPIADFVLDSGRFGEQQIKAVECMGI